MCGMMIAVEKSEENRLLRELTLVLGSAPSRADIAHVEIERGLEVSERNR